MEKINVSELLKGCPKGMELDCTICEDVYFDYVDKINIIHCYIQYETYRTFITFNQHGAINSDMKSKCVIYPKGKTTWEGFQNLFEDGDIIYNKLQKKICIYYLCGDGVHRIKGCRYNESNMQLQFEKLEYPIPITIQDYRLATKEEKEKLFDAIKANGYKWNPETKTLDKLPKFKVGDRIRTKKDAPITLSNILITEVNECSYNGVIGSTTNTAHISFKCQDIYELVPNKFDITTLKPFESRVLVRYNKDNKWCGSFFSHIDEDFHSHCNKFVTTSGKSYPYCIPYEGNEHLLGKTDDCDEYYKNL